MSTFVVPLEVVRLTDALEVGVKAAVLGTLREAGFPVPAGLCLTTAAFHQVSGPRRARLEAILRDDDVSDGTGTTSAARAMDAVLADLTVPEAVVAALRTALSAIADAETPLAVRSSATVEDRADASFAGQYQTVLGVRGETALLAAIVACWRSFFGANALATRAAAGAGSGAEAMAVLIQRLSDGRVSRDRPDVGVESCARLPT